MKGRKKKNMMLLCDSCDCQNECEYYEATVALVVKAIQPQLYTDAFTYQLEKALDDFRCEYYEEKRYVHIPRDNQKTTAEIRRLCGLEPIGLGVMNVEEL